MDDPVDVSVVRKSFQHFTMTDYSVFVLMLGVCTGIGLYFGCVKKQQSVQDYLMGGRDMGIVPVTFSLVASFISGISLLGTPTELYLYGTSYVFFLTGACLMSIVISFTFMPVLHDLQITSAYEYLELRYDKRLRLFGSIIFSFYLMAWLPIVIYVPALAFNQVTGVNIHIVTPIVCFVCIFYTSLGGLKAVVWTDVIQTIVMTGAMILVIIKGTIIVGGFGEVWRRNWNTGRIEMPSLHFDLTDRHTIWSVSIGSMFYWTGNIAVNQSMMQRFLSLPDLKSSKRAVWGFLAGITLIVVICAFSGMLAYARYYDCDPLDSKLALAKDQILPLLVMDVLGEWNGLPGIFVAGVFSAALSSLSTGLNSMSAVVLEDFWKPFFRTPSHKETQILMRAVVVVIGSICVGLVFVVEKLGSVLQLSMSLSSASMGPLTGVFLMGLFLPFIDSTSALSGGVFGLLTSWWVAAHAQLAQAHGSLRFEEKPRFLHNCTYTFPSKMEPDVTEEQGLSTEDAVTALSSLIADNVDKNKKCLTVFLDLKKAFDTVSVPILISTLERAGIRGLVFVVEKLGSVLQLSMSLSSASMGPLTGVFLMGLFLPFIDSTSALSGGVFGLLTSWWVAAHAQLAQAHGSLRFEEKPRFLHNCTYTFPSKMEPDVTEDEVAYLYRISYFWYTAFGCIVTIVVACLINLWPKKKKERHFNELRLYAPVIRKWIASKYQIDVSNGDVELNKR